MMVSHCSMSHAALDACHAIGGKHYSVITFDNGGQWQRLSLPSSETHCVSICHHESTLLPCLLSIDQLLSSCPHQLQ